MNYTTNYHLPQWVETDRIMMEDFNDAMSDIDQGIKTAQDTAEMAYSSTNQPYVTGQYTGTGADITITLGFRPKILIVSGMQSGKMTTQSHNWTEFFALCDGAVLSNRLAFTDTGFIARAQGPVLEYYPDFTESGRTYSYIAFR